MSEYSSLEQEFKWTAIAIQLRSMPREVLEQQCLLALLGLEQQKAVNREIRDHLDRVREVLHALG